MLTVWAQNHRQAGRNEGSNDSGHGNEAWRWVRRSPSEDAEGRRVEQPEDLRHGKVLALVVEDTLRSWADSGDNEAS
jgi:hypothetical protein